MADFHSQRFGKDVFITRHARSSMDKRKIDLDTLKRVIEDGEIKRKNDLNLWIFMHIEERTDNSICAAVVESDALIVKTAMIDWQLEDES